MVYGPFLCVIILVFYFIICFVTNGKIVSKSNFFFWSIVLRNSVVKMEAKLQEISVVGGKIYICIGIWIAIIREGFEARTVY